MEALGSVAGMVKSLSGLAGSTVTTGIEDPEAMQSRVTGTKNALANVLDGIVEGFGADGGNLSRVIDAFKGVVPKLSGFKFPKNVDAVFTNIGKLTQLAMDEDLKKLAEGKIKLLTEEGMESAGNSLANLAFLIASYKVPAHAVEELAKFMPKQGTIDTLVKKISTIDNLITAESDSSHSVAAAFKSGKLNVTHTFPKGIKANITVQVDLNAKKLAKGVSEVTFGTKQIATKTSGGAG